MREMASSMGFLSTGDKVSTAQMLGKAIGQLAGLAIAAAAALGGGLLQALISVAQVMNDIIGMMKWVTDHLGMAEMFFENGEQDAAALEDYKRRNGGSTAGISDSRLNDSVAQMGFVKPDYTPKQVTNQLTTNVQVAAPPGGTMEDGRAFGEGLAQGNQRGTARFFESVNVAQGT
jgi:hypothetical protein